MAVHELKTWPEPFQAMWDGRKVCEFRKDDREPRFNLGDYLRLREYDPKTGVYSDRLIVARISDVRRDSFGIPEGYAMLSLSIWSRY